MRTGVVMLLVGLLLPGTANGQSPPASPGPTSGSATAPERSQRTGTSRIRGRVLSAETGAPIRGALVQLAAMEFAARSALTDVAGRYEFAELPAGRFMLRSTRSGYLTVQYGQHRPLEAGKPLELGDAQAIDHVDLLMPRGRAIAGRIVDETGEPLAEATVTVRRQQWLNGHRMWLPAGRQEQTDDLGEYRVYGLSPGAYHVTATVRRAGMGMFGSASAPGGAQAGPAPPTVGYAPTYYPGTAALAEAHTVIVAPDQDTHGIDFQLVIVPLARVAGLVRSSDGRPVAGTTVTLGPGRGAEAGEAFGSSRTDRDGTFTLMNIPPGDYTLQVRSSSIAGPAGGEGPTSSPAGPAPATEFASVPLTVAGEHLSVGAITTTRGAAVSGRVVFEGERPPNSSALRVATADETGGVALAMISGSAAAPVRPDGTFEANGLSGVRLFRVLGLPAAWSTTSIRLNGVEVIDQGIDFKGTDVVSGLEIVLSQRTTDVAGTVLSAAGAPVADYTVVVFAEDPAKWRFPSGRWVTGTRPGPDGRFRTRSLPAGAYYAVALDYIAQGEWTDPDLLERLKAKAQRFSLGEGESKTLELTLGGGAK